MNLSIAETEKLSFLLEWAYQFVKDGPAPELEEDLLQYKTIISNKLERELAGNDRESKVIDNFKHDFNYYRDMIYVYDNISTQKSIPREIIIPVYEYLYELGISDLRHSNLIFNICFTLAQEADIESLEDLKDWFEQEKTLEVDNEGHCTIYYGKRININFIND